MRKETTSKHQLIGRLLRRGGAILAAPIVAWRRLPKRGRRLTEAVAAFGLLAVPAAALAQQGGNGDGGSGDLTLQQVSTDSGGGSSDNGSADNSGSSSQNVSVNSTQSGGGSVSQHVSVQSSTNSNAAGSSVTINGKKVHVPDSGNYHKTITSDQGQTDIDISSDGDGTASNNSNLNVQINTDSQNGDGGQ